MVVGVIPPVEKRAQCELLTSSAIRFWIIDSVVVVDDDDDDDDDDDNDDDDDDEDDDIDKLFRFPRQMNLITN